MISNSLMRRYSIKVSFLDHTMASDFQSRSSLRESLLNYSRIDPSFPSSRHSMTSNSVAPSHVSFCLPTKDVSLLCVQIKTMNL